MIGVCDCGAEVTREIPTGPFAGLMTGRPFICDECVDRFEAEEEAERVAVLAAKRTAARELRLRRMDLPAGLRNRGLDRSRNPEAFAAALRWSSGEILGLVLSGPIGTGKSTLAAAALTRFVECSGSGRWVSAPVHLARLGSGFGDVERQASIDALLGTGALVLDDIDKVRPSEFGAEQLFVAIDHCIAHGRPLLVTTNLEVSQIAARYVFHGEAITSRLVGLGATFNMDGTDRRMSRNG